MVTTDLKYATRLLARSPGATGIMVFTLALGIGAATAIFSVVYGVLLSPLPYPDSSRIMAVWEVNDRGTFSRVADPNFDDFRDRNRTFKALAKYIDNETSVAGAAEPIRATVAIVTKDFFDVLGVQPVLGRGLAAGDARPGAQPAIVASDRYWKRTLGGASDLSRFKLRIDGRVYDLVGVMPQGFEFPKEADLWVPAELDPQNPSRTSHNFRVIGRLRDGVTPGQAAADISRIAKDVIAAATEHNDYLMEDATALPLLRSLTGRMDVPLYVLLGAVVFLLLVACVNVANLLLSQAAARTRELAIRTALGAGRAGLVRQLLTESLLLGLLGCGGGLVLALWGVAALRALAPANLPRIDEVAVSWPALLFAAGLSVVVAVGLGMATALRATRRGLSASLLEGGRGQAGSRRGQRLGRVLVATQFATTLVLLVGAGLLGRSLLRVLAVDPGFRTDGVVAIDLAVPSSDDPAARAHLSALYDSALERLRGLPDVREAGINSLAPMGGGCPDGMFLVMSHEEMPKTPDGLAALAAQPDRRGEADFCVASAGYFRALGIPLRRGRLFDEHDGFDQPHVALISEALARTRWPGQDPLGRTIEFGNMDGDLRLLTIVGVVGDTHDYGREQPARPTVYASAMQRPRTGATLIVRTAGDPDAMTAAARGILRELAPDVPPRFRTLARIVSETQGGRDFDLTLVGAFALAALLLAVAGIYGVTAYGVAQRTREIGVRIALGARGADVLGMIVGQGLRTTLVGVGVGLAGALALTRLIQSLLFGVTATDPLTFAGVTFLLAAVAALACYVPARRATRVDPMVALRQE
jgi:predicted permease